MRGVKPHSPNTPSWRGAQLNHRDSFTFTFSKYHNTEKYFKHIVRFNGIYIL